MAKYHYQEDMTRGTRTHRDDSSLSSYNEYVKKRKRVKEDSYGIDKFSKANGTNSKPLQKNNKRRNSISLVSSDASVESYTPTTGKTKSKVNKRENKNSSSFRSTEQWTLRNNPNYVLERYGNENRNTKASSDYFVMGPFSDTGCPEANVNIKRLKHMKKLNYQQNLQELANEDRKILPASLMHDGRNTASQTQLRGRDSNLHKTKYKQNFRPTKSFTRDKMPRKQELKNRNINIMKINSHDKEKDMDNFHNLKQTLVEFVSSTFLYSERKHNDQNQNKVRERTEVRPSSTLVEPRKIHCRRKEHRSKGEGSGKLRRYSFCHDIFSDNQHSAFPNSLKESISKNQQHNFSKQFQNYSKNYNDLKPNQSNTSANPMSIRSKRKNVKRNSRTKFKNKTRNGDFKQTHDHLKSDVVVLKASDSKFLRISDFLNNKHSKSMAELQTKVIYDRKKLPNETSLPEEEKSKGLNKKSTNEKCINPIQFPLDSLKDVLVFTGKIEAGTLKHLSKRFDKKSFVRDLPSRMNYDKNSYRESNNGEIKILKNQLENNSGVSSLTSRIISDNNFYQEFNNNLSDIVISKQHGYKPPPLPFNKIKVDHSSEYDMIPELERPSPDQNLKRKQRYIHYDEKNISNKPKIQSEKDLSIKCGKKSANEPLGNEESKYLRSGILGQDTLEGANKILNKLSIEADADKSNINLSDYCTLNEIEINDTEYSRFKIDQNESSPTKTTLLTNLDKQLATKGYQEERYQYNHRPLPQAFTTNNHRPNDSKLSVSTAVQTDLLLTDELDKRYDYLTNTKGTITSDLYENIYINKHIRSQIEKPSPKFVQTEKLSLTNIMSNGTQTCPDAALTKTSNTRVQSESEILVPAPIISEPDDFFDDFITENIKIRFEGKSESRNILAMMHKEDRKTKDQFFQHHSTDSRRTLPSNDETELNSMPIKGFIHKIPQNEITNGFNSKTQLSTQEISDARTAKYSENECISFRSSWGWPYESVGRQSMNVGSNLTENIRNLKISQIIENYITENMKNNDANKTTDESSPSLRENVFQVQDQGSDLEKKNNLRIISQSNNKETESPIMTHVKGRTGKYNGMKTKLSLQKLDENLPYQSKIKPTGSALLSSKENEKLVVGFYSQNNIDVNNTEINWPKSLHQKHSIQRSDENNLETKKSLAKLSFVRIHHDPSYEGTQSSEIPSFEGQANLTIDTLYENNMNGTDEGSNSDTNFEDTKTPPVALQSFVDIHRNSPYQVTKKSNSAGLLSSKRSDDLRNNIGLVRNLERRTEGMQFSKSLNLKEMVIKLPNLVEEDNDFSISHLPEQNIKTDTNKLFIFDQLLEGPSPSSQGHLYKKDRQDPAPTNSSSAEGPEKSKGENGESIEPQSQYEHPGSTDKYNLPKKQSVHNIVEDVSLNNNKSVSDANVSLENTNLNCVKSNLSSFDHILLNISIRDKKAKTPEIKTIKTSSHIPFKKSLVLMPISHIKHDVHKRPNENNVEISDKSDANKRCFNEACVTPANQDIKSSSDIKTQSNCCCCIAVEESTSGTESSNIELNSKHSLVEEPENELGQTNDDVKSIQAESNKISILDSIRSNTADSCDKTSQADKLKKPKKMKGCKRKINRIFLCNYITYIPFINVINKLRGKNITTVDKEEGFLLYTKFIRSHTKNQTIDDHIASINYSINKLKNNCFGKQNMFDLNNLNIA